jgi:hypothetical protein
MKDLLDKIITFVPEYIADIIQLISSPKHFALERVSKEQNITNALMFLITSIVAVWVIQIPIQRTTSQIDLAEDVVVFMLETLAFGAAICLSWRIVRGSADIKTIFVIHFYFASVIRIIMTCGFLVMVGAIRASDPSLYTDFMDAICKAQIDFTLQNYDRIMSSRAGIPLIIVYLLFMIILAVWIVSGWGAYREVNRLSRLRSFIAFMLFALFSIPIIAIAGAISSASVSCG